eukprot:2192733-Prymnesium_polylepis.1
MVGQGIGSRLPRGWAQRCHALRARHATLPDAASTARTAVPVAHCPCRAQAEVKLRRGAGAAVRSQRRRGQRVTAALVDWCAEKHRVFRSDSRLGGQGRKIEDTLACLRHSEGGQRDA